MLHLLHPAALWSLAALAWPLAIHLWRPPPRTVRLGSLRFLESAPRRLLRNLRWRELLLLCTRLGLIAALSLLLAEPRWIITPPAGPRQWALLDPSAVLTGDSLLRWQEAQRAGDELRRLVPGFPAVTDASSPDDASKADAPDLWSLLREADAELPAGSTLNVFSPLRVAAFRGIRPALTRCQAKWFQTPDAADVVPHVWIISASAERIVAGRSDARSTTFAVGALHDPLVFPTHGDERWLTDPGDQGPNSAHILFRENYPTDVSDPWALGTPPPAVSVLILHDAEHSADARYVEAAAHSAADSVGRPLNLQNRDITPDAENAATADWTFWLSAQPVPGELANHAPRIVSYAPGDAVKTADWIVAPSGSPVDGTRLWKRTVSSARNGPGLTWWRNGEGNPLLSYSHSTGGERWEFYSHFDPDWTELPRTTALPAWLRVLLFPEAAARSDAGSAHDRRLSDPAQGRPSEMAAASIPVLAPANQLSRDLHWPLWTGAALLFTTERILSLRRAAAPAVLAPARRPEPTTAATR